MLTIHGVTNDGKNAVLPADFARHALNPGPVENMTERINEGSPAETMPSRSTVRIAEKMAAKEDKNALAGYVRESDKILNAIGGRIGSIKEAVQAIIKQYPPFTPDSTERLSYLMSIAGLRREINALTFPPPPDESYGDLGSMLGEPGSILPELPLDASDDSVRKYLVTTEQAETSLSQKKATLAEVVRLMAGG